MEAAACTLLFEHDSDACILPGVPACTGRRVHHFVGASRLHLLGVRASGRPSVEVPNARLSFLQLITCSQHVCKRLHA